MYKISYNAFLKMTFEKLNNTSYISLMMLYSRYRFKIKIKYLYGIGGYLGSWETSKVIPIYSSVKKIAE